MALIQCPECKKEISDKAEFCPKCGYDFSFIPPPVIKQLYEKEYLPEFNLTNNPSEEHEKLLVNDENIEQTQPTEITGKSTELNESDSLLDADKKRNLRITIIALSLLFIITSGIFIYYNLYVPYQIDKNAKRVFTFAESTFLRSSAVSGLENNKISTLSYGTELKIFTLGEFSSIKTMDDIEGFVSSNLLLDSADFFRLHGVWGDNECRRIIKTTKCRKAILDYYKAHDYYGLMNSEISRKLFPTKVISNENIWQIFCNSDIAQNNSTTYFGRIINKNSKYTDFGVIIKNIHINKRKFLLFTFTDDEISSLVWEEDCPETGYISSIKMNSSGTIQVKFD